MLMFGMLAVLMVLIVLGMPLVFAMGIASVVYLLIVDISLSILPQRMAAALDSFVILAIPLFYLAGELMNACKVTDRIIDMSRALTGHVHGALAQVNIVASMLFAGASGSATADTAALGSVLIPAMKREGYDAAFSGAVTVASAMVGPIIPPSIVLVMYGVLADQSVGKLLLAGIVPGAIIGGAQMLFTYVLSRRRGYPRYPRAALGTMLRATRAGIPALLMPLLIVGGILSGFFTPTEAAGVAVLYGLILGTVVYRNLGPREAWESVLRVCWGSTRVLVVVAMASAFSWIVVLEQVPQAIVDVMLGFTSNPHVVLALLILLMLLVGTFMVASSALVILTPILVPVAQSFGIDPIHFGVLMVFVLIVGGGTPPVGVLLYIVEDIAEVPFGDLVRAMVPFYIPIGIAIVVIALFPELSLYIPSRFL